jgi:hypothetical protein
MTAALDLDLALLGICAIFALLILAGFLLLALDYKRTLRRLNAGDRRRK